MIMWERILTSGIPSFASLPRSRPALRAAVATATAYECAALCCFVLGINVVQEHTVDTMADMIARTITDRMIFAISISEKFALFQNLQTCLAISLSWIFPVSQKHYRRQR
eukprot:2191072-Pyramimonas_sp.AAC.1